ncbi:MAG: uracil-DNA glycosylase, partial [Parvularcula sp.]|nr:uracil-DNA glycosylase [Parvularcula sp.]
NAIYWRPPGNRNPTKAEVAVCGPFVRRFIALSAPRLLLLAGNVPTQALFPDAPGITRSRGQWREWSGESGMVPALPIFHPAFLLRQPAQKRWAWKDLLSAKSKLKDTLR